jgi:hypothetical protein
MGCPKVQFTVRRLIACIAVLAILCALPIQVATVLSEDPARREAIHNELRAAQRLQYARNDPENAANHLNWYKRHKLEAQHRRSQISWGRFFTLTFVGLEVGFVAWQGGLRRLSPLLSAGVVILLVIVAEISLRLPWEVELWLLWILPPLVGLLALVAVVVAILPGFVWAARLSADCSSRHNAMLASRQRPGGQRQQPGTG